MVVRPAVKPQARAGDARSVRPTKFKVWCDIDGYVVGIEPTSGQPIQGNCVGLSTEMDASGFKITEVVMDTQNFAPCRWTQVNGVWVCA